MKCLATGGFFSASEDFRLLLRRRAGFRPVTHGPETAAVLGALLLAPADVAADPGFSPCRCAHTSSRWIVQHLALEQVELSMCWHFGANEMRWAS